jgi:hypothetical protein
VPAIEVAAQPVEAPADTPVRLRKRASKD